jgi:predicted ATPase
VIIKRLILKNWRNFKNVDVNFGDRVFLVGPNAAGKSNFLEVFRFLRDIARTDGGGLQKAIENAGGMRKIRCLAARRNPNVEISVTIGEQDLPAPYWIYTISMGQDSRHRERPYLVKERISHFEPKPFTTKSGNTLYLNRSRYHITRPDDADKADPRRLTQTLLEQTFANKEFRQVATFFEDIRYLHLVPQMVRHASAFVGPQFIGDPFGLKFMERLASTEARHRRDFLNRIEGALKVAVPRFKQLKYVEDERGKPHVEVVYTHWRPAGAKQREDQFSDGTIRLLGLLWSLLESGGPLLLEEPELSLNNEIVRRIPSLMNEVMHDRARQVFISTHSYALLSDPGIGSNEVLVLRPHGEGTSVKNASDMEDVRMLVEGGMSVGEAVLPLTGPKDAFEMKL